MSVQTARTSSERVKLQMQLHVQLLDARPGEAREQLWRSLHAENKIDQITILAKLSIGERNIHEHNYDGPLNQVEFLVTLAIVLAFVEK